MKIKQKITPINSVIGILAIFGLIQLLSFSTNTEKEEVEHIRNFNENYHIFSLSPPSELSFADENIPLDQPEVNERLDREIHANTYFHSNTILYFKRVNRWFPVIEPILKKNNIPDDFKYLALIESGLQNVISPAGATGYWQFLKDTGREYGLQVNDEVDERYHVEKSTEAACRYLQEAYDKFGSWSLVAASYNVGMARITNELERQKASSYYDLLLNDETARYVYRISAVKHIIENPNLYGFNIRKKDLYNPLEYEEITIDNEVKNFADFAKERNISYKVLKYFNPWLRQSYLHNPTSQSYQIKIPLSAEYKLSE